MSVILLPEWRIYACGNCRGKWPVAAVELYGEVTEAGGLLKPDVDQTLCPSCGLLGYAYSEWMGDDGELSTRKAAE